MFDRALHPTGDGKVFVRDLNRGNVNSNPRPKILPSRYIDPNGPVKLNEAPNNRVPIITSTYVDVEDSLLSNYVEDSVLPNYE